MLLTFSKMKLCPLDLSSACMYTLIFLLYLLLENEWRQERKTRYLAWSFLSQNCISGQCCHAVPSPDNRASMLCVEQCAVLLVGHVKLPESRGAHCSLLRLMQCRSVETEKFSAIRNQGSCQRKLNVFWLCTCFNPVFPWKRVLYVQHISWDGTLPVGFH